MMEGETAYVAALEDNKRIAKYTLNAFGGSPKVRAYYHETENLGIDILRCDDRPSAGATSYATIGLSDCPMYNKGGQEFPTRIEIAAACATADDRFANVLASAAFCIMRTNILVCPGAVLPRYVREYFPRTTVPHLYFTAPFLWEQTLTTLDLGSKRITWLLVVPISDREYEYLHEQGDDRFETLLEAEHIDMFDLHRPSVV